MLNSTDRALIERQAHAVETWLDGVPSCDGVVFSAPVTAEGPLRPGSAACTQLLCMRGVNVDPALSVSNGGVTHDFSLAPGAPSRPYRESRAKYEEAPCCNGCGFAWSIEVDGRRIELADLGRGATDCSLGAIARVAERYTVRAWGEWVDQPGAGRQLKAEGFCVVRRP